jgi:mono/diheme cytochrome c family protein
MRWTVTIGLIFAAAAHAADEEPLSFNRDVRPILSEHCYKCHGPDGAQRKADLRLDLPPADYAASVLQGKDEPAALIARITSSDPDVIMPPPDAKLELSADQINVLAEWVESGAAYEPHWAFVPPERVEPPAISDAWGENEIDAFVFAKLQAEGLTPAADADKATWLRRVTFDLTGLPPTIDEIEAFLADDSAGAYENVVKRLLARPAYGERMAVNWLDVARYADTYGYQNDRESRVWPWRDWLIRAFNENMPYDEFVVQQIAGDLLPDPSQEEIIATAFNRLHRQTNEGGSVLEEWRVEYVADRTTTYGTAFLGMTFDCARCHDHKFDPVSQKEFYELFAFFNNIDESGMYSHFTSPIPSPALLLHDEESREETHLLRMRIAELERMVEKASEEADPRFQAWAKDNADIAPVPEPVFAVRFDDAENVAGVDSAIADIAANLSGSPQSVEGRVNGALQFSGDNGFEIQKAGVFERDDSFSFSLWIKPAATNERAVVFHRSKAAEDAANRGYEMLIEDGRIEFALCHFWPGNAIRVRSAEPIQPGAWTHVAVTYDGSSRADGVRLYMNGEAAATETIRDGLYKTIRYEGEDGPPIVIGSRFRDSGLIDGAVDEFSCYDRQLSALEVRELAFRHAETAEDLLREHYLLNVDEDLRAVRESLHAVRGDLSDALDGISEIMVMEELPNPRQAYVLDRGHYAARTEPVSPDTPENILPFPEELPRNRLGLAKWTVDPENPLTARVEVNRIWRIFFGRGLVETQEDFGVQGSMPTHPELLDYLAAWFVDHDWDIKALCKLIATSATYRQSSGLRPELLERDPVNALLARGPRYRLSGEQIRDAALFASGLLVEKAGGPSVKPYQPEGLWEEASSLEYVADTGDGLYRRSMYTFWKRTVPPPDMLTFDAPTREACIARREETSTPLQALVLLNSTQFVEAARVLAEDVLSNGGDSREQIETIVCRLLGRFPTDREAELLGDLFAHQRDLFAKDPDGAAAFVSVGERPRDETIEAAEVAAMTSVVQAVMGHDAFVMKS